MVCESWRAKLDNYLDGELPSEEMRAWHSCAELPLLCDGCPRERAAEAQYPGRRKAVYSQCRVSQTRATEHCCETATRHCAVQLDDCNSYDRLSLSRGFGRHLPGTAASRPRTGLQRTGRPARSDAGRLIASRCSFHRSAHGEAMVPGEDSLHI